MTPISIKISDITYVDFQTKKILDRQLLPFDKMELRRLGLINFDRLLARGHCQIATDDYGNKVWLGCRLFWRPFYHNGVLCQDVS